MLTPQFSIEQEEEFIILNLKCPFIKAQSVEISVGEKEFRFYAKPYFLRLNFPHELIEDGREYSSYDLSSGIVHLKLPKLNKGQFFEDLDLTTKLMDIKPSNKLPDGMENPLKQTGPLIQVIDTEETSRNDEAIAPEPERDEDVEIDWNFPQSLESIDHTVLETDSKYGFNNLYQGYGKTISELAQELIDVQDIDHSSPESRRNQRMIAEELQFDAEYFMWDSVMNQDIPRLLDYKPDSYKALRRIQKAAASSSDTLLPITDDQKSAAMDPYLVFSEKEQEQLRMLPNKEYLIDPVKEIEIFLGLVDIMFAYCYNVRSTEGEDTVESAWTICRLSGTLSALDSFSNIDSVLKCSLRRILSYPLYRSFALAQKVHQDVVVLFKLGKRALLKCLLQIKTLLSHHESMFLMDRIYTVDYCVWIQHASPKKIASLASQLNHFLFTTDLCKEWELDKLQREAMERKEAEE